MPEWLSPGESFFLGCIVGVVIFLYWKIWRLDKK